MSGIYKLQTSDIMLEGGDNPLVYSKKSLSCNKSVFRGLKWTNFVRMNHSHVLVDKFWEFKTAMFEHVNIPCNSMDYVARDEPTRLNLRQISTLQSI